MAILGQRATPVKWVCRGFREIPVRSDPEETKDQSVPREIPVLWDHRDQRANAAKKGNGDLPANRGLPESKDLKAN